VVLCVPGGEGSSPSPPVRRADPACVFGPPWIGKCWAAYREPPCSLPAAYPVIRFRASAAGFTAVLWLEQVADFHRGGGRKPAWAVGGSSPRVSSGVVLRLCEGCLAVLSPPGICGRIWDPSCNTDQGERLVCEVKGPKNPGAEDKLKRNIPVGS